MKRRRIGLPTCHGFRVIDGNIPLPRPGVYLITHIDSGKTYVGISQNVYRRVGFHGRADSPRKFKNAIKKWGPEAFTVQPIYYSLGGTDELKEIEVQTIIAYDSINHGYNIIAESGGVGPYGAEFNTIMKAAKNTPNAIEKVRNTMKLKFDTVIGKKQLAAMQASLTVEVIKKRNKAITIAWQDPELRKAKAEEFSNRIWVTDGSNNRRIRKQEEVPLGWWAGRVANFSRGEKHRQIMLKALDDKVYKQHCRERRLITDGVVRIWHHADKPLPDNFQYITKKR